MVGRSGVEWHGGTEATGGAAGAMPARSAPHHRAAAKVLHSILCPPGARQCATATARHGARRWLERVHLCHRTCHIMPYHPALLIAPSTHCLSPASHSCRPITLARLAAVRSALAGGAGTQVHGAHSAVGTLQRPHRRRFPPIEGCGHWTNQSERGLSPRQPSGQTGGHAGRRTAPPCEATHTQPTVEPAGAAQHLALQIGHLLLQAAVQGRQLLHGDCRQPRLAALHPGTASRGGGGRGAGAGWEAGSSLKDEHVCRAQNM